MITFVGVPVQLFFLSDLELTVTQQQVASERQTWLRDNLSQRFQLWDEPLLTGSYARHTQIRRDRDIDILLPLDPRAYWRTYPQRPRAMIADVLTALQKLYPQTRMSPSGFAITLQMTNIQVDVVPAVPAREGFYMHDGKGDWKLTNPPFHKDLLEDLNAASGGKLKPLVKLMKAWNTRSGAEEIPSFPLEIFVAELWRGRQIPTFAEAVAETLDGLSHLLDDGADDPWEEGGRIYESPSLLGSVGLRWRRFRSASVARDAVKDGASAHHEKAVSKWREVFGPEFPAWG